jgi:hypothetical protein
VAELVVLNGARAGAVFELPDIPAVLGRSPEAHFQVDDPWISSMHAMFERRGAELWVVDLESRNGTFVGEARVTEARLAPGSALRFGRTEARIEAENALRSRGDHPTPSSIRRVVRDRDVSRPTGKMELTSPIAMRSTRSPRPAPGVRLAQRTVALLRLALHLGPEGAAPPAEGLRAALDALIRAALHEGGLCARAGASGALAVFGLSGPSPDDVDFALRAARSARASVRALSLGLDVRAAVDSGLTLVGNVSGPDGFELSALGDAAERVERILALAAGGEILAGPGAVHGFGLGEPFMVRMGGSELAVAALVK